MSKRTFSFRALLPKGLSYKLFITICISLLVGVFMVIMVVNSVIAIRSNSLEMSKREAQFNTDQMVSEIDDKLENMYQYYLYSAMDEDIEWFLSNRFDYSDYNRYKQISSTLGNTALFPNYINGYIIVNFNNGKVISSRGIYELDEMINREEIEKIYEYNSKNVNWGNFIYIPEGSSMDSLDAGYRLNVDTKGLNYVLNLPMGVYSANGFILANINMDEWKRWIWNELRDLGKYIVVLDSEGAVIYSNNAAFEEECRNELSQKSSFEASRLTIDHGNYIAAGQVSTILGWKYFVAYDYGTILGDSSKLLIEFMIAILVFATISFLAVSYALYRPVERLVREVTEDDKTKVKGNELQYLVGQFENLKNDKEALNLSVIQKKEKLAEMFEMRIIRSAVSSDDEWNEYIKVLGLTEHSFYAVVAILLDLNHTDNADDEINEDAISLELAENLPETLKNRPWLPLIYDSCTLTCILASDSEDELMKDISSYYEEIKKYVIGSCGFSIQMGVSEIHTRRNHLGRAYHESVYALTKDVDSTEGEAPNPEEMNDRNCRFYIKPVATVGDDINLKKYIKELIDGLKSLDKGACYRLIDEFSENIKSVGDWTVASTYLSCVVDAILIQAVNMQIDISSICPEGLQNLQRSIVESGDIHRVRKNLKKLIIDPIFTARHALLEDHSYQMMAQIEKKLADSKGNITLNQCADELNVTPTYIWKIMKAERGKTFSEYQEEYKIEEAKRLLQTSMSVSDIATELGYTNAQNFIRFFSKGTGLTPGKYRKLMYGSV